MEDNVFQNLVSASRFFNLYWESIKKDIEASCINLMTFHCIQKNSNPDHLPCLWINASPCSIWYMIFLIADSGNNLFLYGAEEKSYKSRFTNENGIHFGCPVRTYEYISLHANLSRSFDNKEQRKQAYIHTRKLPDIPQIHWVMLEAMMKYFIVNPLNTIPFNEAYKNLLFP